MTVTAVQAAKPGSAVVTGASSGIGRAIAERLLADGWHVIGLDLSIATIDADTYAHHAIDLTDPAAIARLLPSLTRAHALVHSAGLMRGARLGALDHNDSAVLWKIHVDAAIRLADGLTPAMPNGGRIVLIGSRAAKGIVAKSQYGAAKAALSALARSWAKELVARGITVNVVSPAATETPMLTDPARTIIPPETPPLGRRIKPDEIASLVAYLLSPAADAITGQDIAICGGASL